VLLTAAAPLNEGDALLLIPTTRGAHTAYCDEYCARQADEPEVTRGLWIDVSVDCIACHSCGLGLPGSRCLCRDTGTYCLQPIWQLSRQPRIMLEVLSMALGAGGLTDAGWDRAVELAEDLWDGHRVALAWLRSLEE
jgi:hypothetical protein